MKSSRLLIALFAATALLSACGPAANITCNELSFYLDPALGSGADCVSVPENPSSDIPMDIFIYPTHTELTIQGYPLTRTQWPPMVIVYPLERFSELLPDVLPRRVADLESLLAGGDWESWSLPFLPPLPMGQTFYSNETVLSFRGGRGLRYITHYSEASFPLDNQGIFYTFQGITDDGLYWVSVTLPVSSPILPDSAAYPMPPAGYTDEEWSQNFPTYVREVKAALNAQDPASFFPTIDTLDSLIESISIGP